MFSAVRAECLLTSNMASSYAKLYAHHTVCMYSSMQLLTQSCVSMSHVILCTQVMLVMEFMAGGNLKSYLDSVAER